MARVTTYQLAYRSGISRALCDACVERGDHGGGSLGPVQHGPHYGSCEGRRHRSPALVAEVCSEVADFLDLREDELADLRVVVDDALATDENASREKIVKLWRRARAAKSTEVL